MIPVFPKFKKLTIQDRAEFEKLTHGWSHYTEYSFATSFSWNTLGTLYISNLDNNLVIRFHDPQDGNYHYSIIGTNNIEDCLFKVIDHSYKNGSGSELHFISHEITERLQNHEYLEIVEDRDNHDYLLSIKEFIELKGGQLADKRHKINHFERHFGENTVFKKLNLDDPSTIRLIRKVVESWRPPKADYTATELIIEFAALERMLKFHRELEKIEAYGLFINNRLEAFNIVEKATPTIAIGQFEKANKNYTGIFEYLNHKTIQQLHRDGFTHVNMQQDLGYPGLRKAKSSYWPVVFQKKYKVRNTTYSS